MAHLPPELVAGLRDLHISGESADSDPVFFHFGNALLSGIFGEQAYDRLFLGAIFDEVDDKVLYVFARDEEFAAEIEDSYALHLSIVASQISGTPVEFVQVLPERLRQCE